jgi:hypothetical protein
MELCTFRIPQRYQILSFIRTLSEVKMILDHVHKVHYSPVNIDESDDRELDPLLTGQPSKKPGNEIGKY